MPQNIRPMLFLAVILTINTVSIALDTEEIDIVRTKAMVHGDVLQDDDIRVIDGFLNSAFDELFAVEDFTEIVRIRADILARQGGPEPSQYAASFIAAARKQLKSAFEHITEWDQNPKKTDMQRNLIILTAELQSIDLLEFAFAMLDNQDSTVRYWAVKSVTNPGIVRELTSAAPDTELISRIVKQLDSVAIQQSRAEILDLIAEFLGRVNDPETTRLLLKIADLRIAAYKDWTVEYELTEAGLLKALGNRILVQTAEKQKAATAVKFAQLYSYVMQRYILGADTLSQRSRERLISVIVEVEQTVLGKLMGRSRSDIKRAMEKAITTNYDSLEKERAFLLGSSDSPGELATVLNFDYGKDTNGKAITAPVELSPQPEPETKAETAG